MENFLTAFHYTLGIGLATSITIAVLLIIILVAAFVADRW